MTYQKVISIHGVPRSGTSWLGQIFNKHSQVTYKFQPLFSYRFKGRVSLDSSPDDIRMFLDELYQVNNDDFIAGKWPNLSDINPTDIVFHKKPSQEIMVMKEVRYHHLIERFIQCIPNMRIVGIVRNPCAVINSWLKAPKEFQKEWDVMSEWRYAQSKNLGRIEEYYGFEKWKELAMDFLNFEQKYPNNFFLLQYEHLVMKPIEVLNEVFSFSGLHMESQVVDFIKASQSHHLDDTYAVYKSPSVKDRWHEELDSSISEEITSELRGTSLERFLV